MKLIDNVIKCALFLLFMVFLYLIIVEYLASSRTWIDKTVVIYLICTPVFSWYLSIRGNGKGSFDEWGDRKYFSISTRSNISVFQAVAFVAWVLFGFVLFASYY